MIMVQGCTKRCCFVNMMSRSATTICVCIAVLHIQAPCFGCLFHDALFDKLLSCRQIAIGVSAGPRVTADNLVDSQISHVATNMKPWQQPYVQTYPYLCAGPPKLKLISAPCSCWGCVPTWFTANPWQCEIELTGYGWAKELQLSM